MIREERLRITMSLRFSRCAITMSWTRPLRRMTRSSIAGFISGTKLRGFLYERDENSAALKGQRLRFWRHIVKL